MGSQCAVLVAQHVPAVQPSAPFAFAFNLNKVRGKNSGGARDGRHIFHVYRGASGRRIKRRRIRKSWRGSGSSTIASAASSRSGSWAGIGDRSTSTGMRRRRSKSRRGSGSSTIASAASSRGGSWTGIGNRSTSTGMRRRRRGRSRSRSRSRTFAAQTEYQFVFCCNYSVLSLDRDGTSLECCLS